MRNDGKLHKELARLAEKFQATGAFLVMLSPCEEGTKAAMVAVISPDVEVLATVAMIQRELADWSLSLAMSQQQADILNDRSVN